MKTRILTVRVERERLSDGEPIYVALCLELDLACQGATVEEAMTNVRDAVTSFFEVASPSEIERRLFNAEVDDDKPITTSSREEVYGCLVVAGPPRQFGSGRHLLSGAGIKVNDLLATPIDEVFSE